MNLGEILKKKNRENEPTITASPNETVMEVVRKLAEHDKGALPVCNSKGELVGIITERDIVRKCFTAKKDVNKVKVEDVMSRKVAVGRVEDDLDYAIGVMKQEKIRHLPIVENKKVIGIISMRDLLGIQLEECRTEVRYLSEYISGGFV